jgi:preprotein translocase subunit SecA
MSAKLIMFDSIKKIFAKRSLEPLWATVAEINALEGEVAALDDEQLKVESEKLRARIAAGKTVDDVLVRAFALARETAKRTLGQRPFDVQLLGGLVLHQGGVAEMMTGEGKTLSAVAPTYLNALAGKGAHVITVNEYLARRDAVWMGQIYRALGLTVACIVPGGAFLYDPLYKAPEPAFAEATAGKEGRKVMQNPEESKLLDKERDTTGSFLVQQEFLRPVSRREAYLADVTYGTNHEFGFDYLRDNLAYALEGQVQREHHFAIIDEVDSILIDEARTPLIIAAPDQQSSDYYKTFARIATNLKKDEDYEVDEKRKSVSILDSGVEKVEKMIGVPNIYAPENIRLVHYLEESVKAQALFFRDRDYVVKNGEVVIVDEFTGRMLMGRRYQAGLHQAIEAKEGVLVQQESRTYAKISVQNYFRLYKKIAGMTGTAQTSAEEFFKVYQLEVVSVPPNRPLARKDANDLIYKNFQAKVDAVVRDVAERSKRGQPILLGTTSIAKNEIFSAALSRAAIKHEVLNAKNNEREGAIIAQAGRPGAVTVATNVAGRGVDILLGGNPPTPEEAEKVRAAGGLHVLGTERHEARRIDNQLRGRAGRQGDPGSTQFFLSLEDDLMRIFGGDRMKGLMERFDVPDDQPIEFKMVTNAVAQAQEKVEGANFDLRKHLLDYDDVLNKQRAAVYRRRNELLAMLNKDDVAKTIVNAATAHFDAMFSVDFENRKEEVEKAFQEAGISVEGEKSKVESKEAENPNGLSTLDFGLSTPETARKLIEEKAKIVSENPMARNQLLSILDMLWMTNLEDLEALQEAVGLRAYGQRDPLVEYRQEASRLFKAFWGNYNGWVFANIFKLANGAGQMANSSPKINVPVEISSGGAKVGRNDPCPCGSGRKWKQCGLANTKEHQENMARGGKPKHEVTGG